MNRLRFRMGLAWGALALAAASFGPRALYAQPDPIPWLYAVGDDDSSTTQLEIGDSLRVAARSLAPNTLYELRMTVGREPADSLKQATSFARTTSNAAGDLSPVFLWYQSGVVGCSERAYERLRLPWTFRTFEEADRALEGQTLTVTIHPVARDTSGRTPPMSLEVGKAVAQLQLPANRRIRPLLYPADRNGCLANSFEVGRDSLYIRGTGFRSGSLLNLAVVPNQRRWRVGDTITDISGSNFGPSGRRVEVNSRGEFLAEAWLPSDQRYGAYDVIAYQNSTTSPPRLGSADVFSYGSDTAAVFYLYYPIGGPLMDIAGRPINSGYPYYEFADSFAKTNDPVWGAVDPTYVPVGHPGGTYAAYYVVNHKSVAGWNPMMGGNTSLNDVSGNIEIHPVKAGCVNGTDVIIWDSPLSVGKYDVVVDFGPNAAATPGDYVTDQNYDESVDFLDGASQIGFQVAADPYDLGTFAIGQGSYSQDDYFATLGSRQNVDLRAVVRYPATAPGLNQPVAAGTHPIFIIEHGNHRSCNVAGFDFDPAYDAIHTGCPQRTLNHMGYMGLLDRLASQGIIAVSIDAYDLTGHVPQLIPERSQLILKHLELWSHMNDHATFNTYPDFFGGAFVGHVNMNKISVSGHSRGGEASVGAYMLNGGVFNIGSVSSIAPVDGQSYVLPDVPYFVILPAGDGDVSTLSGQRIYDRAGSGIGDATTKSGIDVYGANHNFFNTVWAVDGDDSVGNRPDYIAAAEQQKLGEAYLAAFARANLNGETVYDDMLRGRLTFPSFAGKKIYNFRHEKDHSKLEDGLGTLAVASNGANAVSVSNPAPHSTKALKVSWLGATSRVVYSVPLAQQDTTGFEVLSFRVAQTTSASNPVSGSQDFEVELSGGGQTKATHAGRFFPIPKPYDRASVGLGANQTVMTTVRIPLHSFIMNNSGVDLSAIDTLTFRFTNPTQGEIYVDDVEFSR